MKLFSIPAALLLAVGLFVAGCDTAAPDATGSAGIAAPANGEGAIIIRDGICGMAGADADGNIIFGGIGEVTRVLQNRNRVSLTCHGEGITNDSGQGQSFRGFECGIVTPDAGFVTDDSHATVSASGQAMLNCNYRL